MIIKKEVLENLPEYLAYVGMDKSLRMTDKGMLLTLIGMPEDFSFNADKLSASVREAAPTVRYSLNRLETKGYIRRKTIKDSKNRLFVRGDLELYFPPRACSAEDKTGAEEETEASVSAG